jgi:CubicO group peptidase (beta-lactamase class C family)
MEQKRLAPEDKVQQVLRSWQIPGTESGIKEVTLRHLLHYDPAGLNEIDLKGYERNKPFPNLRQVLDGTPPAANPPVHLEKPPGKSPRRDRSYLTSHIVLQQLLEDIENRPFHAIAADTLFTPMGLTASTFDQPLPEARWPEAVTCHDGHSPLPGKWLVYPEAAAMGLWTNPSELARLIAEFAKSYRGLSTRFVSRETAAKIVNNPDYPFYRTYSDARGCECDILFNPNTGEGSVLMMNSSLNSRYLRDEILHAVFMQYRWTWGRGLLWSDTFTQGWMLALALGLLALTSSLMAILHWMEQK